MLECYCREGLRLRSALYVHCPNTLHLAAARDARCELSAETCALHPLKLLTRSAPATATAQENDRDQCNA